jgi:hypothetical protein
MNTKGMKFLAVLAVLAMAFAAFAVIAPDTGSDAADPVYVQLSITGGTDAVADKPFDDVVAALTYLGTCTDLDNATKVAIKLGADYNKVSEPLTTFGPVTEFDLNGKDFKVAVANNDHPVVTLGADLTIKNGGGADKTLTIDTIDVKGKKLIVEGLNLTATVDTYKSSVSGGSVKFDANNDYTTPTQEFAVTVSDPLAALFGDDFTATITTPGAAAAVALAAGSYAVGSIIVFNYTGQEAAPTVFMNGNPVTLGENITLQGDAAFTNVDTYTPAGPTEIVSPSKITFDSITVNMLGKNPSIVNIVGDVVYTGTIDNDVEFTSLNRASVTFGNSKDSSTFAEGKAISFVGNMLTVGGTIKKATADANGNMTISTNDKDGNSTSPAFKLKLPDAVVTIADRLDVTGSFEAKEIKLNGKELFVHQASSLKVVNFVKNADGIANDEGRFGVDAGATFTVTGVLTPAYATAVHKDPADETSPIVGYKYSDFTYNSYVLGSFILTVDVADHTATPNPDPVPELQKIPMFSFVYSWTEKVGGKDVQKTKILSMLLPSNNKFPTIKAYEAGSPNAGNIIKGYNDVVIGWTDVKDSKTVKYAVGDALPQTLATVYYPIYESDISDLSISGTVTYAGKESDAQYLYGQEIVATNIDTGKFYTATVGQDGSFQIVNMKSGTYNIKVPTMEAQDYDVINGGSVALTLAGVTGLEVEYASYVNITINVTSGSAVSNAVQKVNLYADIKKTTLVASNPAGKTLTYVFKAIYSTTATDVYYAEGLDGENPAGLAGNGSVVVSYDASATFNIVLDTPVFTVSGLVKLDGEPVSGITVVMYTAVDLAAANADNYSKKFGEAVTDDKGKYTFYNVPNNTFFKVVVDNEDYEKTEKTGTVDKKDTEVLTIALKAMPWMFYLTVWYNGAKVLPENLGELVVYYGLDKVLDYKAGDAIDDNKVRIDKDAKKLTIYLSAGEGENYKEFTESGQLFVQASSYSYVGNISKEITQNKESIEVELGVLSYNLFGMIVNNGGVDPKFDMENHLTITTSTGVVTPHLVEYVVNDELEDGTVAFGETITVNYGNVLTNANLTGGTVLTITWPAAAGKALMGGGKVISTTSPASYVVDGNVEFTVDDLPEHPDVYVQPEVGAWVFYVTNLADQTTGDVAVDLGDYFKALRPFKIESKDIGNWTFDDDTNLPLIIMIDKDAPTATLTKNLMTAAADPLPMVIVKFYKVTGVGDDGKEIFEEIAALSEEDDEIAISYGAKVRINAVPNAVAQPPADFEFVVTVNGASIVLDKEGNSEIFTVVENIKIAVNEPPVYTEDLLVTLGQKGQKVVVVFTALDDNEVKMDANGNPVVDDHNDPVLIEKTIPSIIVNLELNYSYINEFGDVTAESYEFSVEYTEVLGEGAAFEFSDDDFATKLGDNYQYAFSITGSYVFGEETVKLSKTAYKPVPAAEA